MVIDIYNNSLYRTLNSCQQVWINTQSYVCLLVIGMQWLNGNISFFVRKCILDSFLCWRNTMHQNTHYVHSFILQWDIPAFYAHLRFYICARACLLLRPNKITKKSFLLNDPHLRNRDKPLTILFLCYSLVSLFLLSKKIVAMSTSFSSFSFLMHDVTWSTNTYANLGTFKKTQ